VETAPQLPRAAPPSTSASPAARNAYGLYNLPFNLFGRPEVGWAVYAPRAGQTLHSTARADGPAFAEALRDWQQAHGLPADGVMDEATLRAMKAEWQGARPFLAARVAGVCPDPPAADALAFADPRETHYGKPVQLRAGTLAAYRRMVAAARATGDPRLAAPHFLIFSGYRDPAYDAQRCAIEGNCQGVVRAACSAHRTGLAMDLALDTAPGFRVDDSADVNRLAMERGYAYRWLLTNAARFGFVNYAFEPWHWEWTGEPP
jgi:D-alanyl-D-alanine carboxypeptidase